MGAGTKESKSWIQTEFSNLPSKLSASADFQWANCPKCSGILKVLLHFFFSSLPNCPIKMCLVKHGHILLLPRHIWARGYAHFWCVMDTEKHNILSSVHHMPKMCMILGPNVFGHHPCFLGKIWIGPRADSEKRNVQVLLLAYLTSSHYVYLPEVK
jgi:hypothetical protein